jgi:hypothetical protein
VPSSGYVTRATSHCLPTTRSAGNRVEAADGASFVVFIFLARYGHLGGARHACVLSRVLCILFSFSYLEYLICEICTTLYINKLSTILKVRHLRQKTCFPRICNIAGICSLAYQTTKDSAVPIKFSAASVQRNKCRLTQRNARINRFGLKS